ncbi:MAG TPA: alanine racemase, partial [Candidatus Acetothermia bacterium]|nr:alanine racemase [Candidatus Acetothermia bacterium]HEX32097.1 alanine racemase [Candidatus Acetothermia bacterium]
MAQTVARVDLSILIENIDLVRNRVPRGMKVLFAVKSDAYGHGIEEISRSAEAAGIDYLGVDTVDEGVKIRSAGIKLPILLLAPILPCEIDRALQSDLTPSIGDIDSARLIANRARGMGRRASVQVNVDTGMGRFGA